MARVSASFGLLIGIVMVALGAFIALHPLWSHGRPFTASMWLDLVFALFFLLRGTMYLRAALRRR